MFKILNFAYYTSKSCKWIKQTPTPPFWGDVGVKKWSQILDSGTRSPIFGHLKMGTWHFQVPKNGTLSVRIQNLIPLFQANIPPKCWSRCLFYSFTTVGRVIGKFWILSILGSFLECKKGIFYKMVARSTFLVFFQKDISGGNGIPKTFWYFGAPYFLGCATAWSCMALPPYKWSSSSRDHLDGRCTNCRFADDQHVGIM